MSIPWLNKKSAARELPAGLMEFIPYALPGFESPFHMSPIVDAVEAALYGRLRLCISTPPQHGKTSIFIAAIIWLLRNSNRRHAYVSYNEDRGHEISQEMQYAADAVGLKYKGKVRKWSVAGGGSILATGTQGKFTGSPVDGVLIADDLIKDDRDASSFAIREATDSWFRKVAMTRCHPSSSVIVCATRWNEDDQIGRLKKRGWDVINLEAIDKTGKALWPAQRPIEFLRAQRKELGEADFEAMFQGNPQPRGMVVYGSPTVYAPDQFPHQYRVAIGVDIAGTGKTLADWCIAVVLAEADGRWFVIEVLRRQTQLEQFAPELRHLQSRYPNARTRWHGSQAESAVAGQLRALGVRVEFIVTTSDKFVRAGPSAAQWRQGRLMVPEPSKANEHWLPDFLKVVSSFKGDGSDRFDDDPDALGSAFDCLPANNPEAEPPRDTPEWRAWDERRHRKADPLFDAALRRMKQRRMSRSFGEDQ